MFPPSNIFQHFFNKFLKNPVMIGCIIFKPKKNVI